MHECENCGYKFTVKTPLIVPTADDKFAVVAMSGQDCAFIPETGVLHPLCPECGSMSPLDLTVTNG